MKNPDIVALSETEIDDETVRKVTLEAVSEAVSALVAMREREGAALAADLSEKLASIEASLEEVKKEAPRAVAEYRRKLRARIDEALGQLPLDEASSRDRSGRCLRTNAPSTRRSAASGRISPPCARSSPRRDRSDEIGFPRAGDE